MTQVLAPVSGQVHPLSVVADEIFSSEMVGSGVCLRPGPDPQTAVAPVDGELVQIHPHAFVVSNRGRGVLVHLGVDTVKLLGEGFEKLAAKGDQVTQGQPLIRWNPAGVETQGYPSDVIVCVLDTPPGSIATKSVGTAVNTGDLLFELPDSLEARR